MKEEREERVLVTLKPLWLWNDKKFKHKQHMLDESGLTYCRAENSDGFLKGKTKSVTRHPDKDVCMVCKLKKAERERKKERRKPKYHPKPNGGSFYLTKEWVRLRYRVLDLYGPKCMCCGATPADGAKMHVDHIIPVSKAPERKLDITNLQVMCSACNWGKGADSQTDWRQLDEEYRAIMRDELGMK
jgi:5-methylcytosine-specific restriction endonuclease McrA